jgi:hypothetical protein
MTDTAQLHCTRAWYKRPPVWLLGVVVVVALVSFAIVKSAGGPAATPYGKFLDQLDAGNVASVTFKHEVGDTNGKAQQSFHSQVPVFGDPTLLPELRKEHVAIGVGSSQWLGTGAAAALGIIGAFLLAKPMLLVIAAAFIAGLVRVARGGKMDIRSILSMLPMFRSAAAHDGKEGQSGGDSPRSGN